MEKRKAADALTLKRKSPRNAATKKEVAPESRMLTTTAPQKTR